MYRRSWCEWMPMRSRVPQLAWGHCAACELGTHGWEEWIYHTLTLPMRSALSSSLHAIVECYRAEAGHPRGTHLTPRTPYAVVWKGAKSPESP